MKLGFQHHHIHLAKLRCIAQARAVFFKALELINTIARDGVITAQNQIKLPMAGRFTSASGNIISIKAYGLIAFRKVGCDVIIPPGIIEEEGVAFVFID